MGGYGSTRWRTYTAKPTAEESLRMDIAEMIRRGWLNITRASSWGWLKWTSVHTGEERASIMFDVVLRGDGGLLTLHYTFTPWRGLAEHIALPIRLSVTYPYFGGVRYWMHCPACGRRCGTLYKPPGASRWKCRLCHHVTYRSAQEAHKYDGLYADLAVRMQDKYPGMTAREVGRLFAEMEREQRLSHTRG
jgi:hypothetical protein